MSGFFGRIAGAFDALEGAHPASANLIGDLVASHGGMDGLMDRIDAAGLGDKLQSWVGDGVNIPMAAEEVEKIFPPEQLDALAQKHGVPAGMVPELLAKLLPHAVDQATGASADSGGARDGNTE